MNAYSESVHQDIAHKEHVGFVYRIARIAHDRLCSSGGFSFSVQLDGFGDPPTSGYMVGLGTAESVTKTCTVATIAEFILSNWDALSEPNTYIGGWQDDKVYLDISEWISDPFTARLKASERNEKAYYSITTGETIYF